MFVCGRAGQLDQVTGAQLLGGEQFDDLQPQRVGERSHQPFVYQRLLTCQHLLMRLQVGWRRQANNR